MDEFEYLHSSRFRRSANTAVLFDGSSHYFEFVVDVAEVVVLVGLVGSDLIYDVFVVYFVKGEAATEVLIVGTSAGFDRVNHTVEFRVVDVLADREACQVPDIPEISINT